MTCPICGCENAVIDAFYGYVICTSCGTVVEERIPIEFIENAHTGKDQVKSSAGGWLPSAREGLKRKVERAHLIALKRLSRAVRVYEAYASRARSNVVVDLEALKVVEEGGRARVFKFKYDDALKELLNRDAMLNLIMVEVVERDPILGSRTYRAKVAAALIIKAILEGRDANLKEVCSIAHVSPAQARRLLKAVRSRLAHLRLTSRSLQETSLITLLSRRVAAPP